MKFVFQLKTILKSIQTIPSRHHDYGEAGQLHEEFEFYCIIFSHAKNSNDDEIGAHFGFREMHIQSS